ncbi:hypothetical protein V8C43DRAFT_272246 [Trichoderma afarasin]
MKFLALHIRCYELLLSISVLQVQSRIQHHDNTTLCHVLAVSPLPPYSLQRPKRECVPFLLPGGRPESRSKE